MNRAQSRAMWKRLADADFDADVLLWVANVAGAILKADDEPKDSRRYAAIVAASGLFNRLDHDKEIIRAVVRSADFDCELIERGAKWRPARRLRRGEQSQRRREAVAAALGLELTPNALDLKIKRALAD